MSTRKVTLSIEDGSFALGEVAARNAGMSMSQWVSKAIRRQAVEDGAGNDWGDPLAEAFAADADDTAAEMDLRAAG